MMTTAIVQEASSPSTSPSAAAQPTTSFAAIPPHVLIVGKKNAVDYIAPALFRLGSFGELVVKAKGSLSIVTAVNVAEMVRRDIDGLETRSVRIGTDELVIDGATRRVSYIEIHLAKPAPATAASRLEEGGEGAPAAAVPAAAEQQQLAQPASAKPRRTRKAPSSAAAARKKPASASKKRKAPSAAEQAAA